MYSEFRDSRDPPSDRSYGIQKRRPWSKNRMRRIMIIHIVIGCLCAPFKRFRISASLFGRPATCLRYLHAEVLHALSMAHLLSFSRQQKCVTDDEDDNLTEAIERDGEHYIGIGEHSDLWKGVLVVDGVRTPVAIKVLRGGSSSRPDFREQLIKDLRRHGHSWRRISHTHVAKFYGFVYNFGMLPGLVLEFYEGNVMEYTKRENSDETKLRLIGEIALGLRYLHQHWPSIIHGDLRGANILVDKMGHAIVADYGLALIIDSSEFTSIKTAGTCRWTAPEIMSPPPAGGDNVLPQFTLKSDIFSYAMTVIEIFSGEQPFNEKKSDSSVIFAILNGNRPAIPEFIERKAGLAKLLKQCWSPDPDQRPTARQICRGLGVTTWYGDWLDTVRGYLPV